MRRAMLAGCLVAFTLIGPSHAQPAPEQPQTVRRFDLVSGILFICSPVNDVPWTGDACRSLTADFKRRSATAKVRFEEVPIIADFRTAKYSTVAGFERDKAVRVFWFFKGKDGPRGSISASLSSNIIYEPTKKDHPNIVPGQRLPLNFYTQSALYDPGVTFGAAKEYLDLITGAFFESGEEKVAK